MPPVGWIGTGALGSAAVRRLAARGVPAVVWNRTIARAAALSGCRTEVVGSPAEVVGRCELVFSCLTDDVATAEVLLDAASADRRRALRWVVDLSTIGPSNAIALAGRFAERGVEYVEAPVSGGPEGAVAGTLTAVTAGERAAVERVRPVLEELASTVHYVGPHGRAQVLKVANNLAESVNLLAAAEAVALASSAGLDLAETRAVLSSMRGRSEYMTVLFERLTDPDGEPGASLAVRVKDLALAKDLARAVAVDAPMAALAERLFSDAAARHGPMADQTLCRVAPS